MSPMNRKPRILLVEDDQALATVYKTRMEAEGFEVRHCDNGESALSNAIEFKPDLILLDVMMPRISGFDVLDILRNTPETANTKIIILSALGQPSDRERARQLGVDEYLVKSQAVITDVMARLRHHLGLDEGQAPTGNEQAQVQPSSPAAGPTDPPATPPAAQ